MSEENYSKREIDLLHTGIHEKLDLLIDKVTFTNGKVKKIIIALTLMFGLLLGLGFQNAPLLLSIIL